MAAPGSPEAGSGALFGAPVEGETGTRQGAVAADIVILPGGLMLVEQSSPRAKLPGFSCDSGDIHCDNGRP